MKTNKYKILVLSDLKESTNSTLKSTVNLAKMIGGDIVFFHVRKPTDVVERDNQLSAIRNINEKHIATDKVMQNITQPISEEYGVNINYKFSFGNVKHEIDNYIKESKPDIIVLGKKQPRKFKLLGDSITHHVLKNYSGVVVIASDTKALEPNTELSLGVLNGEEQIINIDFAKELIENSKKPLKSFKIIKNANVTYEKPVVNNKNIIEYVFEQGDNALNNLSKYVSMSNINLLFVDRTNNNNTNSSMMESDIQSVMDNYNISLLVCSGKLRYNAQIQ